jgi:hypothetical protein
MVNYSFFWGGGNKPENLARTWQQWMYPVESFWANLKSFRLRFSLWIRERKGDNKFSVSSGETFYLITPTVHRPWLGFPANFSRKLCLFTTFLGDLVTKASSIHGLAWVVLFCKVQQGCKQFLGQILCKTGRKTCRDLATLSRRWNVSLDFWIHFLLAVVGKLLFKSSWVTLLQLLVKVTRYF